MAMSPGSGASQAQINMTPMIDILLVLIIIFMVITPVNSIGLRTLVPQPAAADRAPAPAQDIVVTVREDGTVRLNQERVGLADLAPRLAALFKTSPNRVLFVRGEGGLMFGPVAQVIDIATGVGLSRVALMTD